MSYERTTKDPVGYIANKFAENPGHFAATILRMYWDMEKQRDQYKSERDTLIDDIAVLRANNKRLKQENESLKQWYQMHKECADAVYKKKEEQQELLEDFSSFIYYKLFIHPNSDVYKKFRYKLDKLGVE